MSLQVVVNRILQRVIANVLDTSDIVEIKESTSTSADSDICLVSTQSGSCELIEADTLGAIAGPMAYTFFKEMPQELIDNAKYKLPQWMLNMNAEFDNYVNNGA